MQPMHNYVLAGLAAGLFAPLIKFHLVVTLISKRDGLVTIEGIRRTNKNLERDICLYKGLEKPKVISNDAIVFVVGGLNTQFFLPFHRSINGGRSLTPALLLAV
jgi:hypothetical protein